MQILFQRIDKFSVDSFGLVAVLQLKRVGCCWCRCCGMSLYREMLPDKYTQAIQIDYICFGMCVGVLIC